MGDSDYAIAMKTGVQLAADVRSGLISAAELLEVFIRRTEQLNPAVNAIVVKDYERARARAAEADAALTRGELWGPLHGVPMTVKENNDVAGLPTTKGDPARAASSEPASVSGGHIAPRSEVMVERLLAGGAIVFGKSNLPLNAMDIQSYNEVYGSSSNPWDLGRTPGGSSGGGAAAVALGLTPLELGGDIGGSVRIPAAFNGIYGHKPTFGIIPKRGPTSTKVPTDISVRGPLARSTGKTTSLLRHLLKLKLEHLPRQARDRHSENFKKEEAFSYRGPRAADRAARRR
jgi:amidase